MDYQSNISQNLQHIDSILQSPSGTVLRENAALILGICKELKANSQQLQYEMDRYALESQTRLEIAKDKIAVGSHTLSTILEDIKGLRSELTALINEGKIDQDPKSMTVANFLKQELMTQQRIFVNCYTQLMMI